MPGCHTKANRMCVHATQMAMLQRFQSCHLVMTVGSYRRMTNLAEARTAGGGFPKVSPEHRLQFTFDKMSNVAAIAPLAGVRRSIPEWCGVKVGATLRGCNRCIDGMRELIPGLIRLQHLHRCLHGLRRMHQRCMTVPT